MDSVPSWVLLLSICRNPPTLFDFRKRGLDRSRGHLKLWGQSDEKQRTWLLLHLRYKLYEDCGLTSPKNPPQGLKSILGSNQQSRKKWLYTSSTEWDPALGAEHICSPFASRRPCSTFFNMGGRHSAGASIQTYITDVYMVTNPS